ncbi:MAG: 50S ribosomal protein L29 [Desulfobacterales bacterium]|nr:50S ribosomal protein L29 [Desulfobacterales bacterium]
MEAKDIREMDSQARSQKLAELQETLFNLRFQHESGQLENPRKIEATKRDIARIKTVIRETTLNPNTTSEA